MSLTSRFFNNEAQDASRKFILDDPNYSPIFPTDIKDKLPQEFTIITPSSKPYEFHVLKRKQGDLVIARTLKIHSNGIISIYDVDNTLLADNLYQYVFTKSVRKLYSRIMADGVFSPTTQKFTNQLELTHESGVEKTKHVITINRQKKLGFYRDGNNIIIQNIPEQHIKKYYQQDIKLLTQTRLKTNPKKTYRAKL
jgi:hypothetical protein